MIVVKPLITILIASTALPVAATPVFNVDFDNTVPTFAQGDGSGVRTLSYNAATGLTTDGVGGTLGSAYTFDLTGITPGAFTFSNPFFQINNTTGFLGATSNDASDYEVSFDVRAEGFADGISSVGAQFDLDLGDAEFQTNVNLTDTFTTFTANLGDIALDSNFDSTDFTAGPGNQRQFQLTVFGSGDDSRFGLDAGNAFFIDNFQVNEVPEPASLALLSVGGVCLLSRRRRIA